MADEGSCCRWKDQGLVWPCLGLPCSEESLKPPSWAAVPGPGGEGTQDTARKLTNGREEESSLVDGATAFFLIVVDGDLGWHGDRAGAEMKDPSRSQGSSQDPQTLLSRKLSWACFSQMTKLDSRRPTSRSTGCSVPTWPPCTLRCLRRLQIPLCPTSTAHAPIQTGCFLWVQLSQHRRGAGAGSAGPGCSMGVLAYP